MRIASALLFYLCSCLPVAGSAQDGPFHSGLDLAPVYAAQVERTLTLPAEEAHYYGEQLKFQLHKASLLELAPQFLLLADRNPKVQAMLLFWLDAEQQPQLIGASPVSTGKYNGYLYFETPLGIFEHSIRSPDFRAEGTLNSQGLMGYGSKGMRVFDFGWVQARKTWTDEMGEMRLQLHATDPVYLESRLGSAQSMGCIRIPASLNVFLDRYGILDADYEAHAKQKHIASMLRADRIATPWSGRYLLIIDSRRLHRPEWSPQPLIKKIPRKKN